MNVSRLVLVTGGGEFGTAAAVYMIKAGISVVMIVGSEERNLRRSICFSEALFSGTQQVGDVTATLIDENILLNFESSDLDEKWHKAFNFYLQNRQIPLFTDKELPRFVDVIQPPIIVRTDDNFLPEVTLQSAPLVIGLYPCQKPDTNCHFAIESRQNYNVGQVYYNDPVSSPDFDRHFFKQPFEKIHSPLEGVFVAVKNIGDNISRNQTVGKIEDIDIRSPYEGQIWGLAHSGKIIRRRQELALIFEGPSTENYLHFDFKHKVVAGTVLREVLKFLAG
jgi:xanthine dehydrogenase accessory factor